MSLVLAIALGTGWYRAWFNHAWPAPPSILGQLLGTDGERSYDAMWLQLMLTVLLLVGVPAYWALRRLKSRALTATAYFVAAALILPGALLAGEALYVGLIAGTETLAQYQFGSDVMVQHGGWGYQSRGAYLLHGLLWATPFVTVAVASARAGLREREPIAA